MIGRHACGFDDNRQAFRTREEHPSSGKRTVFEVDSIHVHDHTLDTEISEESSSSVHSERFSMVSTPIGHSLTEDYLQFPGALLKDNSLEDVTETDYEIHGISRLDTKRSPSWWRIPAVAEKQFPESGASKPAFSGSLDPLFRCGGPKEPWNHDQAVRSRCHEYDVAFI